MHTLPHILLLLGHVLRTEHTRWVRHFGRLDTLDGLAEVGQIHDRLDFLRLDGGVVAGFLHKSRQLGSGTQSRRVSAMLHVLGVPIPERERLQVALVYFEGSQSVEWVVVLPLT